MIRIIYEKNTSLAAALGLSLLATTVSAEVMLGAFVPGNGWSQENITTLDDQLSSQLSFVNLFSTFTDDWDLLYWQTNNVVGLGMTPMISWMPIDADRPDTNILAEITLGEWDNYIDEWSQRLVAWLETYPEELRPTVLIRFGHEFNGNWYSYGDSPDLYIASYQHVHDRFEALGINDHIEWVWSANNVNVDSYNDITRYYPGESYVDWTSIDGYNWGTNYSWTSWDSFSDVFSDTYNTLVENYPGKPILIAEVGSAEPLDTPDPLWGQNGDDSDISEDKDLWNSDMMFALENSFPAIRAVGMFNVNKELDWSLTEAYSTGISGMNTGLENNYFVPYFLSAVTSDTVEPATPDTTTKQRGKQNSKPAKNKTPRNTMSSKSINRSDQVAIAHSKARPTVNRDKVNRMRQGFLNMSAVAQAKLSEMKLSVLE